MTATMAPTPVAQAPVPEDEKLGLPELWSDTLVYARRNIQHIRQIPEKLLDVTIQPLMFVLLFAFVFGGAIAVDGGGYREYLIGGILIQSLAVAMMGPATAIATDLGEGVIDRFRSLPSTRGAYLLGHYIAELAGIVLSIVVLLAAGLLVGWRTHTDFVHVADVAHANVLALTNEQPAPGAFNVCTGTPHTILDMAQALRTDGSPAPQVVGGYRLGDIRHVFASADRAVMQLGFRAAISFEDGMREFITSPLRSIAD